MTPQIRRFALMYLGLTVVAALVGMWLQTGAGFGLNVAATAVAALDAAHRFHRRQGRAPTVAEIRTFGWHGLLAVWAVFILLGLPAVVYLSSLADTAEMMAGLLRPGMLFFALLAAGLLSGVYYLAIRGPYQWYGRLLARRANSASGT